MRTLLLSLLCLLTSLPTLASAAEILTDPNVAVGPPQPYFELELEVWQLMPEAAIAAGLDSPGATAADKNLRFNVLFRTLKPFRPLLDQAVIDRQGGIMMLTKIPV